MMTILIFTIPTILIAGVMFIAYGVVTSLEHDRNLSQDQLAPFWREAHSKEIDRQLTTWLSTQDPRLNRLGAAWLAQEVQQGQTWSYTDPAPLGPNTHLVTATASITIPIPGETIPLTAAIPWFIRLDQDARGILSRPQGSMTRIPQTQGITASPQWQNATLDPTQRSQAAPNRAGPAAHPRAAVQQHTPRATGPGAPQSHANGATP